MVNWVFTCFVKQLQAHLVGLQVVNGTSQEEPLNVIISGNSDDLVLDDILNFFEYVYET